MTGIALIGHGRMGREIEAVAAEKGLKIAGIFTEENNPDGKALTRESLRDADVCIDFSTPEAVLDNIRAVVALGKNMVVGTTGWHDRIGEVKKIVLEQRVGFVYAANFSLGVNLFLHLVAGAATLFDRYAEYDIAVSETHHNKKTDSPSGTALSLGGVILRHSHRKTEVLARLPEGGVKPHQLHVASSRVGSVTGKHAVVFDSESDQIELVHTAKNRRGFAVGAIVAAEWLKGKRGFFTMQDVIQASDVSQTGTI